jgi:hypothetical protein
MWVSGVFDDMMELQMFITDLGVGVVVLMATSRQLFRLVLRYRSAGPDLGHPL